MIRTWTRMVLTLTATAALALVSGCGGRGPASAPAPSGPVATSAPPSTPSARPPTPSDTKTPGAVLRTQSPWTSGTITVVHRPPVPPVPVVVGVRYAAHQQQGYDRIVLDIKGSLPGYTVRYVNEVRADPSDRPVTVPGRRFLLMVLTPARAHDDDGSVTVKGVHRHICALDTPDGWVRESVIAWSLIRTVEAIHSASTSPRRPSAMRADGCEARSAGIGSPSTLMGGS
jgi:hypothetical protein